MRTPPLGTPEYLYVGTADFDRDCAYYATVLGAKRVWAFHAFGARVAAFRVCQGPLVLLADHRPARNAGTLRPPEPTAGGTYIE